MEEKNLSFIPYAKQHIDSSDRDSVISALQSETITRGKLTESFEKEIAAYCGARYGVAYNSGTSALHAAFFAAQTTPYDRIITTPNTFVATYGPGTGLPPHFVDIDRATGNMDTSSLSLPPPPSRGKNIIVPVHFSGIPVDIKTLENTITNPDTVIIEDASHALGSLSSKTGTPVGSCEYSQMTVFSFHPAKTITTGEGGMVLTNDEQLCQRLLRFRNNGIEQKKDVLPWLYDVHAITGNFHMTEFQAALGLSQLRKLDSFIKHRRKVIGWYRKELKDCEHITLCPSSFDSYCCYHLCVAHIDFAAFHTTRERIMKTLFDKGIGTQVHYIPLYRHRYFSKQLGDISSHFPHMEAYYSEALSLPMYYGLEEKQVIRVCKELKAALGKSNNKP